MWGLLAICLLVWFAVLIVPPWLNIMPVFFYCCSRFCVLPEQIIINWITFANRRKMIKSEFTDETNCRPTFKPLKWSYTQFWPLCLLFNICMCVGTNANCSSSFSLVWAAESCSGVLVLLAEWWWHVCNLRWAEGREPFGVVLQPCLPLLLHLNVHLHGAVALHRPHHGRLWDCQGKLNCVTLRKGVAKPIIHEHVVVGDELLQAHWNLPGNKDVLENTYTTLQGLQIRPIIS